MALTTEEDNLSDEDLDDQFRTRAPTMNNTKKNREALTPSTVTLFTSEEKLDE